METIKRLCDGKYYVIPHNQRGYSWQKRHVKDLLSDLSLAGSDSHYMGPLIVSRDRGEDDFQTDDLETMARYVLEDGQQRLTTFFLILSAIRIRLEILNGSPTLESRDIERLLFYSRGGMRYLKLQNNNPNLHQCFSHIVTGSPTLPPIVTPPITALLSVSRYIRDHFDSLDDASLLTWQRRITNQAKFVWVNLTDDSINRYLAFDAINSRGLPLSEFDKIKNFCILLGETRALGMVPEDEWYVAIAKLEQFGVGDRNQEEAFISDFYSAYQGISVGQKQVHDTFVTKYHSLLSETNEGLEADCTGFIDLWADWAHSFGFITCADRTRYYGDECTTKAGEWLDRLDNMDLATICRVLLTACHFRMSHSDFEIVARACEIYTFRVYAVMRYRKDKNSQKIIHLAHQVLIERKDVGYVVSRICSWLQELAPLSKVIQEIGDGEPKYYYDSTIRGWLHTYYFLYEYEISVSPSGVSPLPWGATKFQKVNTQEHIMPQNHRDGSFWQSHWPDEMAAERYKHRLGNLVLTTDNGTLGRKSIDRKLNDPTAAHCYTHHNATNSEKRIANFTDGREWKERNILLRELELLKFASQRWNMPCCDDNGEITLPTAFDEIPESSLIIAEPDCLSSKFEEYDDEELTDDATDA